MKVIFQVTCANSEDACKKVQGLTPARAVLSTETRRYDDFDHTFTIDVLNEDEIPEIEEKLKREAGFNLVDIKIRPS